jgi:hypothetical protein
MQHFEKTTTSVASKGLTVTTKRHASFEEKEELVVLAGNASFTD